MDWKRVYMQIIVRARTRVIQKGIYREMHHIVPTCLGGQNVKENKVELTYREHFICHRILHTIFPENKELAAAFHISAYGTNARKTRKSGVVWCPSSRALEAAKLAKAFARVGTHHSEETKAKMSETRRVRRESGLKNAPSPPITDETKEKMRQAKLGKKRKPFTEEHKAKLREAKAKYHPLKGKTHSAETLAKMKITRNNRK